MNICMYVKGKDILLLNYAIAIGYLYLRGMTTCLKLHVFVLILGCSYHQNSLCNLMLTERNQNFSLDEGMFQLDKMGGIQNYMCFARH